MNDILLLWAVTTLPSFAATMGVIGLILICVAIIAGVVVFNETGGFPKKIVTAAVALGALMGFLAVLTPDRNGMAVIVGGKLAIDAARTEQGRELGQDVLAAIKAQLRKAAE